MAVQRPWAQQPLITSVEDPEDVWEHESMRSQSTVFAQHYTRHLPSSSSGLGTPLTVSRETSAERSSSSSSSSRYTKSFISKLLLGSLLLFSVLGGIGFLLLLFIKQYTRISDHQEATFSLLWGSAVSFFSCLVVIIDFRINIYSRRHPAPIIFWRTFADFCSATIFIAANTRGLVWPKTSIDCHVGYGLMLAATVQFLALASEGWFCVLIADLVTSLTNPFADYKHNMKTYHMAVWTLAACSFIAMLSCDCAGDISNDMCWLKDLHKSKWNHNKCLWGFYMGWVISFYGYGVVRIIHARFYLIGKGTGAIEETRSARRLVVDGTLSSLTLYMAYVVLLGIAGLVLAPHKFDNQESNERDTWSKHAVGYIYAARGFVDAAVWIGFKRQTMTNNSEPSGKPYGVEASFSSVRASELGDVTLEELDLDLSPQLNPVLRSEIVSNVTSGIRRSVERHLVAVAAARAQQQPSGSSSSFQAGPSLWAEVVDLTLISGVKFEDHYPAAFALIRKSCGLGDMEYVSQVERITAEKLSEGKSGAFMFFSKNGRFIIKTLEKEEADTLHGMLHRYADYLDTHKGSLLSKYLGSHTLHMYGQVFHFIVMLNVFRDAQAINARYDIKGSWVNRSATPATPGARARCRHCSAPFIVGRNDTCRGRTEHEADVVLKDNDFKTKVALKPEQAIALISRLEDDANFLCSEGIMDYSLLIGVHDIQFTVNPHATLKKQAVKRRESLRLSYASQAPSQAARRQSNASNFDAPRVARQESNVSSTYDATTYARSQSRHDSNAPSLSTSYHGAGTTTSHHGIEEEDEVGNSITSEVNMHEIGLETESLDQETKVESAPLNQTNVSRLSAQGNQPPLQWNFDESESEIASEASTVVDILPSAPVTDFSPDYTGFMQPDQKSESRGQSQGRPQNEGEDFGDDFVMEDDESLLLAQLRDPSVPIFQSRVVVGPGLFYVGVVDTLQTWSWKKRLERMWKKWRLSRPEDEHGLSCIAPVPYAERFKLKIRDIVEHDFIRQLPST